MYYNHIKSSSKHIHLKFTQPFVSILPPKKNSLFDQTDSPPQSPGFHDPLCRYAKVGSAEIPRHRFWHPAMQHGEMMGSTWEIGWKCVGWKVGIVGIPINPMPFRGGKTCDLVGFFGDGEFVAPLKSKEISSKGEGLVSSLPIASLFANCSFSGEQTRYIRFLDQGWSYYQTICSSRGSTSEIPTFASSLIPTKMGNFSRPRFCRNLKPRAESSPGK